MQHFFTVYNISVISKFLVLNLVGVASSLITELLTGNTQLLIITGIFIAGLVIGYILFFIAEILRWLFKKR